MTKTGDGSQTQEKNWSDGVVENWSDGVVENWSTGKALCQSALILFQYSMSLLACQLACLQSFSKKHSTRILLLSAPILHEVLISQIPHRTS